MCKVIDLAEDIMRQGNYDSLNRAERAALFDAMINGKLTHFYHLNSFFEKNLVTISTICALCKAFEDDFNEVVHTKGYPSYDVNKAMVLDFADYCRLPVKYLMELWRKSMKQAHHHPDLSLFELITKFLDYFKPTQDGMWVLVSYLFMSLHSVKKLKRNFPIPFTIAIDGSCDCRLMYVYRKKRTGRVHTIKSRSLYKLPAVPKNFKSSVSARRLLNEAAYFCGTDITTPRSI